LEQGRKEKRMRRLFFLAVAAMVMLLFVSLAFAPTDPIPHLINYQGMLTDNGGNPLNGSYDLTFSIYSVSTGGTNIWTESHSGIVVEDGLFSIMLGSDTPIPSSVFEGAERYLGIKVGADPELTPRTRLTSVGYAYLAEKAVSDGDWTISGDNIYSTLSGNVGIGAVPPTEKLDVAGTAKVTGFKMPTGASAGYVLTSDGSGVGTWQAAPAGEVGGSGTENYIPKFTSSSEIGNSVIYQSGSKIGVGTTTPSGKVHITDGTDGVIVIDGTTRGAVIFGDNNDGSNSKYHYIRSEGDKLYMGAVNDGFTSWTNSFTMLRSNGYIGLGTTTPAEKLHVSGDIRLNSGGDIAFADDNTRIYESSNDLYFTADDDLYLVPDDDVFFRKDGGSSWARFDNDNERVGIGTITPDVVLDIEGTQDISGSSDGLVNIGQTSSYHVTLDRNEIHGRQGTNSADLFINDFGGNVYIAGQGKVGIGDYAPTYRLELPNTAGYDGRGRANGWYTYSSREEKKDISALNPEDYAAILKEILEMDMVYYRYNDQEDDRLYLGVIAEDAPEQIVAPDRKSVSLSEFAAFALAGLRAQQAEIEQLKKEIQALRQESKK
jgi:hypothetical protein